MQGEVWTCANRFYTACRSGWHNGLAGWAWEQQQQQHRRTGQIGVTPGGCCRSLQSLLSSCCCCALPAGDASTAGEVLAGLSVLTEACLQHGANVLLMTVMEVAEPEPRSEQQRLELNRLIQQYVQGRKWAPAAEAGAAAAGSGETPQQQQQSVAGQKGSGSTPMSRRGAPRVVLFDLASKLTWGGMDEETRWQMWDDGVHLTIDGYDFMGDLIVEALGPLVQQDVGAAAAAAGSGAAAEQNGTPDHKKSL